MKRWEREAGWELWRHRKLRRCRRAGWNQQKLRRIVFYLLKPVNNILLKMSLSSSKYPPEAISESHTASGWVFPPSPQTPLPIHGVAGSRTWPDSYCGTGSRAVAPSNLFLGSGLSIMVGWSPRAAMGSKKIPVGLLSGGWLVSVGARPVCSSSVGQTLYGDPLYTSTHSTNLVKDSQGPTLGS